MKRLGIVVIALCLLGFSAYAAELSGKVIGVTDGDTIKVLTADKTQLKIRLAHIDAPESGQSYGKASKKLLSELCYGKQVRLTHTDTDRYGRLVCEVFVGTTNANLEMVKQGLAWHFKKYSSSRTYAAAELSAQQSKKGLFADRAAIPPWQYRANGNSEVKTTATDAPGQYWLNTSSNVRHNSRCKYFQNTKRGQTTTASNGKGCGICGG